MIPSEMMAFHHIDQTMKRAVLSVGVLAIAAGTAGYFGGWIALGGLVGGVIISGFLFAMQRTLRDAVGKEDESQETEES